MKNIGIAIRSLFKRGQHNVMKIISLGIGLTIGLVLIAKVHFENTYDNFYPDGDRKRSSYPGIYSWEEAYWYSPSYWRFPDITYSVPPTTIP